MNKKSKRLGVGLGMFLVFALAAGGAYAYWTNNGTGTGSASTASPAAGQFSVSGNAISGLAPGVAAQTLTGTITNNGTNSFTVGGLSAAITGVAGGAGPGCDATDYTLVQPSGVSGAVVAGGTLAFSSGSIAFNNKATNQDDCKGATVTITYTVS
ncbi:MAG: hypothetical protein JHD02_01020 [Thermoleophilaceae bacterium]|nr:hypothetical protein [Thermoleophilaceae bacterium]